jgi:hypothetical protein
MIERGILFSGAMVRALLDGSKTQTRRAVKGIDPERLGETMSKAQWARVKRELPDHFGPRYFCPYGQPGDRLWVRETWGVVSNAWDDDGKLIDWAPDRPAKSITEMRFGQGYYSGHAIYAADGSYEWAGDDDGGGEPRSAWHPSIHMPRAASRILLEIVSVRVERLHDISETDAVAEGLPWRHCTDWMGPGGTRRDLGPVDAYRGLWESLNGAGSWDANPWVWVVEFKRVKP